MAGGLAIGAEKVRDPFLDGDLRAIDALGPRFPSPEMVNAGAAFLEPHRFGPARRALSVLMAAGQVST